MRLWLFLFCLFHVCSFFVTELKAQVKFVISGRVITTDQQPLQNATVSLGTPYPSLNRADAYLFALCTISFDQEKKVKLLESWYALMTYFLILDDLVDIKDDFKNNEENALIEAGLSEQGAAIITDMINRSYVNMEKINPVMSNRIDHKRQSLDVEAIIKSFLKGQ